MADASKFIDIRHVAKEFGSVTAIRQVDLTSAQGEFFSLLGPSGCGKTTLLRMLAGMEQPTRGRIYIDGEDVTDSPPHRRPTNMVFQSYAIFPHLTVGQNIGYGLRRLGLKPEERRRRIGEMLDLIGLSEFADRPSTRMSGGQMQRVALARALVLKPKVLLLDEPLAALDKKLRERMQFELRSLQREVGITFIFVTHDQEEALTLSDRIAVMANGMVLQTATPADLYDKPASREVAEFIGEMNFFPAVITGERAGQVSLDAGPFGAISVVAGSKDFRAGDNVVLALRPERVRFSPTAGTDGRKGITGIVRNHAYFGSRTQYMVEVPGIDRLISVAVPNNGATPVRPSDAAYLSLDFSSAVLLPAQ